MTANVYQEVTSGGDQPLFAFDVSMKGLSAKAISQDLVQTLGAETVAYPTITR
jgi:hypothetical protein